MAKIRAPALSGSSPNVFFCLRPLTTITKTRHLHQTNLSSSPISLIRGLASLSSLLLEHIRVGYRCGQEQSLVIFVLAASHRPGGHTEQACTNKPQTKKNRNWEAGRQGQLCDFVADFHTILDLLRLLRARASLYGRSCGPVVSLLPIYQILPPPDFDESTSLQPSDNLSSPAVRARRRTCDSFIFSITYSYVSRSPISRRGRSVRGPAQTER